MPSGWKMLGQKISKDKIGYGAVAGSAAMLGSIGLGMAMNPVDTAEFMLTQKWNLAGDTGYNPRNLGYVATAAAAVTGAAGVGLYKAGTNTGKLGDFTRGAGIAAKATAGGLAKGASYVGTNATSGETVAKVFNKGITSAEGMIDRKGIIKTSMGVAGLGMIMGGVKTAFDIGTSRPVYDDAMARAEEGSAYEGGAQAFGKRSNRAKSLGHSTMGLTQGLHNSR